MHNLPLACLNVEMGDQISSTIGRVLDSVVYDNGAKDGSVLCVYVEVNIYKSILRG